MIKNFEDFINESIEKIDNNDERTQYPFFLNITHDYTHSYKNEEAYKPKADIEIGSFIRDVIKTEEYAKGNDKVVLTKVLDIDLIEGGKDFTHGGHKGEMFRDGSIYVYPFSNVKEAESFVNKLKSANVHLSGWRIEPMQYEENVKENCIMSWVKEEYREEAEEFLLNCFENKVDLF
jgi:hypothetical protein